jgi:ELWxxDGT repeat protein
MFFTIERGGSELWTSDGTADGTGLLKDFHGGEAYGDVDHLVTLGNTLYFTGDVVGSGFELWKSDGTQEGTVLVADIWPGPGSSDAHVVATVGDTLYLAADDGLLGEELWKSDGTAAGTTLVRDISPRTRGSYPNILANVGNTLYFTAHVGGDRQALWRSDGTAAGTLRVSQVGTSPLSPYISSAVAVGDDLYVSVSSNGDPQELWRSDGTSAGTYMVRQFPRGEGTPSTRFRLLAAFGDELLFEANDGTTGVELWKSDGTESGTTLVKDINLGSGSSYPNMVVVIDGTAYFTTENGVNGRELWRTDGTEAGTHLVYDIQPGPGSGVLSWYLTDFRGELFFVADDGQAGPALWKSDGTAIGTVLVRELPIQDAMLGARYFVAADGYLFFRLWGSQAGLWRSDGTRDGTMRLGPYDPPHDDFYMPPVGIDDTLFFGGHDPTRGKELWKSDGTPEGTVLVTYVELPTNSYSTSGHFTNFNHTPFFTTGDLWKSDGTEAGTVLAGTIGTPGRWASISNMRAVGNNLFVVANDWLHGQELWIVRGASVTGRHAFYNNSTFDGNDPAANAADDAAIAPHKTALLPGQTAGFANYTSFSKGLNGIMIDVANLWDTPTADDFVFRIGNNNSPDSWLPAPPPESITVRAGAGVNGSDRISIVWADGAIAKTWLEVTLLPGSRTGVPAPDVFYFGNAIGETGNTTASAVVNSADEALTRLNGRGAANPAPIDFRFDFNHDGLVNAADQALARLNASNALSALRLIVPIASTANAGDPDLSSLADGMLSTESLDQRTRELARRAARQRFAK